MIGFAIVKNKKSPAKNIVDWLNNDFNDNWNKDLRTMTLILILKYTMLAMSMSADNVYKQTIMTMIYSILIFKIENIKSEGKKYELIYSFS